MGSDVHIKKIDFLKKIFASQDKRLLEDVPSVSRFKHYQQLDELYGSGDFDEAVTLAEDVDRHLASSVESLARLFSRERILVRDLARLRSVLAAAAEAVAGCGPGAEVTSPRFPPHSAEFSGAATALYRLNTVAGLGLR